MNMKYHYNKMTREANNLELSFSTNRQFSYVNQLMTILIQVHFVRTYKQKIKLKPREQLE